MEIGVGQQSLLSQVQLTDPVHLLQAGKTVDILRCAAKSTDLLTPSALLRPLRGLQRPRPPALWRADYRLPPVIVLPLWFFVFIVVVVRLLMVAFNQKGGGRAVVLLLFIFLYYISRQKTSIPLYAVLVLYGIWSLLIIPAFGEIFRQWNAKVGASPPLSSTHFGLQRPCSARVAMRSAAVEKPPQGRHFHLAGVIMLLDVGKAATEEQGQME